MTITLGSDSTKAAHDVRLMSLDIYPSVLFRLTSSHTAKIMPTAMPHAAA